MDQRAKDLIAQGDNLFGRKQPILSLWQEFADNFYPERADFTTMRTMGTDLAANLTTSTPVLIRRDLSESVSTMLRERGRDWFSMQAVRDDRIDNAGREWLEAKTKVMRRAMYDKNSLFVRATKEADNDFVTFGQAVISVELNRQRNGLLYRTWHLRDVAWCESAEGQIDTVHRRWQPTAMDLKQTFRQDQLHEKVRECFGVGKDPYTKFEVRHIMVAADNYEGRDKNGNPWRTPWVSIYIDVTNQAIIEEVGIWHRMYVIPRWQTVSGSQYAYSPCTVAALPDARLIQNMTMVLLEAGEKAVTPPMLAKQDMIRGDISVFASGVTWIDAENDERQGSALQVLPQDFSGIPLGVDLRDRVHNTIAEAFYLNKINLPSYDRTRMTAYEVGQRVQEFVRNALPLFEPMETEYNGGLCDSTFELLMRSGAFGSTLDMPESLSGQDVEFQFVSPLHEAIEKQKTHTFAEARAMLAEAAAMDPSATPMLKVKVALRDCLNGNGTPAEWIASEEEMAEAEQAGANTAADMQMLGAVEAGAVAAEQVGKAAQALQPIMEGEF